MFECHVCKNSEASEELVNEIFQINSKPVLVENIPAKVCGRCGEVVFSRETTEKIRRMLHGDSKPIKSISVDVFAFN